MSLNETLQRNLADWRPHDGRQTLEVASPEGWTVSLAAECVDRVGCLLWEVSLRRTGEPLALDLPARAGKLAEEITVLLEPLQVVEVDEGRGNAQLRSRSPRPRGEQLAYHELLLQADGSARLARYQAGRQGGRREQVAFTLTYEALGQLVSDLTA